MNGIEFQDKMHELVFRGLGASRLGAVQTTVVWQFVIFHYSQMDEATCDEIVELQEKINAISRDTVEMEKAIALLLNRVNELDTGRR